MCMYIYIYIYNLDTRNIDTRFTFPIELTRNFLYRFIKDEFMVRSSHVTHFMKNGVKLAGRWLIRITKEWTVPRGDTASHSLAELHYFSFLRSPKSTKHSTMMYDVKWIIPKLRTPTRLWNIASSITFAAVGIFSKILIGMCLFLYIIYYDAVLFFFFS